MLPGKQHALGQNAEYYNDDFLDTEQYSALQGCHLQCHMHRDLCAQSQSSNVTLCAERTVLGVAV